MSAETPQQYWAAWIYGFVLTGLFSVSTIFHAIASFEKSSLWRDLFHRGDRAMIYLFIAGSYTPWLTLKSYQPNGWASQLSWAIWILACLGIIYQQLFHERYKWLETTIYLVVALSPALAVYEMVISHFNCFYTNHKECNNAYILHSLYLIANGVILGKI